MAMGAGRNLVLLIARLSIAPLFLYTGYKNIGHIDRTADTLWNLGYPAPKLMALVAALAELGGGLSILLGALTSVGCLALIIFLVPTTVSFHLPGARQGDSMQLIQAAKNLATIGGLIILFITGPGAWSIDAKVLKRGVTE